MHITRTGLALVFLLSLTVGAQPLPDSLQISEAWIREAPPNAMALAGYMTVNNRGTEDRQLVAVSSIDFKRIELHRSMLVEGVARMIPQERMPIPAAGHLELKPGDYHLMLMHPRRSLKVGEEVKAILSFDNDQQLTAVFTVKKSQGSAHQHHHHH
ncbi:MAG: copper chaperone PCu(A)C [Gammaproteobacteria bacterium]|nr:copper chaperone PCu(A)C [Gammaproteobacteria bacterium]